MVEETSRTSPVAQRRRPTSAVFGSTDPFRTPSPGGKRPCIQETPNYAPMACLDCIQKESAIKSLTTELAAVRQQLQHSRVVRFNLESRECTECVQRSLKLAAMTKMINRLQERITKCKSATKASTALIRTQTDFKIDAMPEKRFRALFGMRKKIFYAIFKKLEPVARRATYWKGESSTVLRRKPTPPEKKIAA